jgi:FG-GAP-like repeat
MNKYHITTIVALANSSAIGQTCNFEPPESYYISDGGSGATPYYIAAGDIDADGDIDLITDSNGPGDDPTQILWNDGTGSYSLGPVLTSGWGFGQVALGDMDADGDLDVLRANYFSNGVYFFRNNGDGSFSSGTYYSGGGGCLAVLFTDIDGDGDLDFVTINKFGGQIRPYRNINGLGFTSVGLFDCGPDPYGMAAGDLNNDGDMDIVVTNEDDATITVVNNDGTGVFPTRNTYAVGQRPVDVTLADVNGDGQLDAIVANWSALIGIGDTVSVLLNDQEGGFDPQVTYQTAGQPESVRVTDMDGDGIPDLVVACRADDAISILRGNGDGTFEAAESFDAGTAPEFLTIGDVDGDGDTDVAVVSSQSSEVSVMRNICDTPVDPPALEIMWHTGWDNFFNVDTPSHVAVDQAGNIIAAGETYFNVNEQDYYVVKYDSDGNVLWDASYNGTGDHYDKIYDLRVDSTGSAVVTGESWNNDFGVEWATVKFNPNGTIAWTRRYLAANVFSQQRPGGIAIGPADQIAVSGYYINESFDAQFAVAVYDSNGTMLWDKHLPESGTIYTGQARAVAFDAYGNAVVTGNIDDDDEWGEEMLTAKFAPDGTLLWSARHDATVDTFFNETIGRVILAVESGDIYVAGGVYTGSATGNDFIVVKYDADGNELWSSVQSGLGADRAETITFLDDGTLVVSGSGGSGVTLHAFTPDGVHLWQSSVQAAVNSANPAGHITLGTDGMLYLLGQAGTDLAVFQVSASGELLSTTEIDSGFSSDWPAAIAAAPGGVLQVLGSYEPVIVQRRDFSLFKLSTGESACLADFVVDGELNFFDVSAFLQAFSNQQPSADLNSDSVWNFFDVQLFLELFAAGCP